MIIDVQSFGQARVNLSSASYKTDTPLVLRAKESAAKEIDALKSHSDALPPDAGEAKRALAEAMTTIENYVLWVEQAGKKMTAYYEKVQENANKDGQ